MGTCKLESLKSLAAERVFLLAGGRGTRSANPEVPKVLQLVSVSPPLSLLDQHLANFNEAGVLDVTALIGFGAPLVIEAMTASQFSSPNQNITLVEDSEAVLDTSGAVIEAIEKHGFAETNILVLGDTLIGAPLRHYINLFLNSGADVGLAVHPNLHPFDSDRVVLESDRQVSAFIKKNSLPTDHERGGWPVTGIVFFNSKVAQVLTNLTGDATFDIYSSAAQAQLEVTGVIFSHYSADTGTFERLSKAREDVMSGAFARRGSKTRPAIFIDRDGTIIEDTGSSRGDLRESEEVAAIQEIRRANEIGVPVFLVTNQPGIAKGQITDKDVMKVHEKIQARLNSVGAFIDDFIYCPHHPESGYKGEVANLKIACECRKPKPGMIFYLRDLHGLNLQKSYFIGDSSFDNECAEASGVNFILGTWGEEDNSASAAMVQALGKLGTVDHH
jgi:histidinol-phosphate phosphatase family protein